MVNINGNIIPEEQAYVSINNRGFAYGDAVFETIKMVRNKPLFFEDHYFRLMASMRILRMEIPMDFTLEYIENEIIKLIEINGLTQSSARVKFMVHRKEGGYYNPISNHIEYLILTEKLKKNIYELKDGDYKIDLFKDYYISPGLISTLKTNNRINNVIGSIYAKENNYDNCLILNTNKSIVEALNANIFIVKDNVVKTPPLEDGCIKGIMRKQIIEIIKIIPDLTLEEAPISPFELRKADELFLTNVIIGIQPISHYRKKTYAREVSKKIMAELNKKIRDF
jgi:branched-chain amino acid aminotransferase